MKKKNRSTCGDKTLDKMWLEKLESILQFPYFNVIIATPPKVLVPKYMYRVQLPDRQGCWVILSWELFITDKLKTEDRGKKGNKQGEKISLRGWESLSCYLWSDNSVLGPSNAALLFKPNGPRDREDHSGLIYLRVSMVISCCIMWRVDMWYFPKHASLTSDPGPIFKILFDSRFMDVCSPSFSV